MTFWTSYAMALTIVALMLAGLATLGRFLKRAGSQKRSSGAHVTIVESVMLSPRTSLHVVKVGRRHLLVGSNEAHVGTLAEIELDDE